MFRFVAGPVRRFLEAFLRDSQILAGGTSLFVPHQANLYMVRQLADALGLKEKLAGSGERFANTGSCSAALTLADGMDGVGGGVSAAPVLMAGFGAGLSAGAAATTLRAYRRGVLEI